MCLLMGNIRGPKLLYNRCSHVSQYINCALLFRLSTSIASHIVTEAAMNYALLCTSITSLKPFLKPFHAGAIVNTVGGKEPGAYSEPHSGGQGIYMLSSISNNPTGQE